MWCAQYHGEGEERFETVNVDPESQDPAPCFSLSHVSPSSLLFHPPPNTHIHTTPYPLSVLSPLLSPPPVRTLSLSPGQSPREAPQLCGAVHETKSDQRRRQLPQGYEKKRHHLSLYFRANCVLFLYYIQLCVSFFRCARESSKTRTHSNT